MLARGLAAWMQLVSIPWFAVELEATPVEIGLITGLLFLPTLGIAPLGGVLADRVDRGRVLLLTQAAAVLQAGGLMVLAVTGSGSLPAVALFALGFGLITAIELPVRQAYLAELVPEDDRMSAVSLHASAWNTTRFVGPGLAGLLIATVGIGASFAVASSLSFVVMASIVRLERYRLPRTGSLAPPSSVVRALLEGIRFAGADTRIRWAMLLVAVGGIFGVQSFQTLAPLFVADRLGLGGGAFGAFMACWGGGAVIGAYLVTILAEGDRRSWLIGGGLGLAVLLIALALVESVLLAYLIVSVLGFAQIALVQNAMLTVQQATSDAVRGRVMGIYVMVFQGTAPFGAFLAGGLAELLGVQMAMLVDGILLTLLFAMASVALRRSSWHAPDVAKGR